jgi:hypothetical protein
LLIGGIFDFVHFKKIKKMSARIKHLLARQPLCQLQAPGPGGCTSTSTASFDSFQHLLSYWMTHIWRFDTVWPK